MSRPEFDVVMAASTDEALQLAADAPPPGAVVLPAGGSIDGLQVCRTVKAAANGNRVPVILALAADDSSKRDACFAAGADDVLFAPVEAADIASRLDRSASGFRGAPRAAVEIVVRLASPTGSAVLDAAGSQISREAVQVTLPAGTPPPAAGQLVRAVFTLYEGGTLQVWARAAATTDPPRVVLRFVGLTEPERRAIDYFVDFYVKRTAAEPAAEANGAETAASVEELLLSSEIPEVPPVRTPAPSKAVASDPSETVRLISEATLDQLADAAARFAAGRDATLPPGFDVARVRSWLPKLTATETSALRGTTMYNNILGDLRGSAASRLRLGEMTAVLREAGSRVDKKAAENAAIAAMTEAQQIHNNLDAGFQDMIKAGNTAAMRDVQPVKAGLLTACVDLKAALDREVLGKEPAGAKAAPKTAPSQAKYTLDPGQRAEPGAKPRLERTTKESKSKDATAGSRLQRNVTMGLVLVVLLAGALWSNRNSFAPVPPPVFLPERVLFEVQGVRVWNSMQETESITWIIDGTWAGASEEARAAALDEMARRSTGMKRMRVIDYQAKELAMRELE